MGTVSYRKLGLEKQDVNQNAHYNQVSSYLDLDRYEAKCRVYLSLMNKIQNYVCFLVFKVSGIFY